MLFFPFLYEDELMFSVLARYHLYSGNENTKTTMGEMFGSSNICASTIFPANLDQICKRLPIPDAYTTDNFINKHTFLPYFSPFIPSKRSHEIRQIMTKDNGKSLYMKLGKVASNLKSPNYLRYCPICVQEEIAMNGEAYWHRSHQVEGVQICYKHLSTLINSEVNFSERKNKHEFITLEKVFHEKGEEISNSNYELKHLKFIAEQTHYLLNNEISSLGLNNLNKFYINMLQRKGLATVSGRIKWIDFIPKFNQFYGENLLRDLFCYIELDQEDTWLHKLLRKPRVSCHPLRHILLLGFLEENVSTLVNNIGKEKFEPFGSGPWFCLNKAADHYNKPVITSCEITRDYKTGLPVGTFSCSCGFIYSRKGPDKTIEDNYKIGRIKVFGPVWERKLNEISKQEYSLRKKAEMLGVDPATIKRRLAPIEQQSQQFTNLMNNDYREEWLAIIKENNDNSISQIRLLSPKIYMWLYRNDKEWLLKHYPKVEKSKNTFSLRIDWEKRDMHISMQVEKVIMEILELNKLKRVTKNEIGRRIKDLSLASMYKFIDKLPRTKALLELYVESLEQFQIRRIKTIVLNMKNTRAHIKEWEVIRQAGLKKKDAEKLMYIIQQEIKELFK
jgi:hypothetical protein